MKTIHIAPGSPDPSQDGSALWPYRVLGARSFDAIFMANREPTTFLLAPGTYRTLGCWTYGPQRHYAMLAPNCLLIGTHGSNATEIRLDDHYEDGGQTYIESIIGGGYGSEGSNQMTVAGLTVDCSASLVPVSGIHTYSGGTSISDVRVVGIKGDFDTLLEGFGILVNDSPGARNGGNVIVRSRVECNPTRGYFNGIYLGSVAEGGAPNLVDSCHVEVPFDPAFRRPHTAYGVNCNTQIRNCTGYGCAYWLYCDTDCVSGVDVSNCRGDFGLAALNFPSAGGPAFLRRRIRLSGSTFGNPYPVGQDAVGVMIKDTSTYHDAVTVEDLDIEGCRFASALPPGGFYAVSIQAALSTRIWVRNTSLPPGSRTTEGLFAPTPASAARFTDIVFE